MADFSQKLVQFLIRDNASFHPDNFIPGAPFPEAQALRMENHIHPVAVIVFPAREDLKIGDF